MSPSKGNLSKTIAGSALIIPLIMLLSLYVLTPAIPVGAQIPAGIPRGDIFIVLNEAGVITEPTMMNIWVPGAPPVMGAGLGLLLDSVFNLNVSVSGNIVGTLAEGWEYSPDFKTIRIPLRRGIYWSDGVEFTADDVVFTVELNKNITGFTWNSYLNLWVEDVYAEDKYTVVIKLKNPNPRFHITFTAFICGTGLVPMPKHIWENVEDPLKYNFFPPVGTGAYVLDDYDPHGYWFLWRRRDDWERSSIGQVVGKPIPRYVLSIYYETTEKRIMALGRHELDWGDYPFEALEDILRINPYATGFYKGFPYVFNTDPCDHGVIINCGVYPTNITDVRWALTLAINMTEVQMLALNFMGRIATFRSLTTDWLRFKVKDKLLPWLEEFTLPDGYKPFDPTLPERWADYVKSVMGYELAADINTIWGYGWWKYDPEEAARLLEKHGFYRDEQGKWHLPDGSIWKLKYLVNLAHPLCSSYAPVVAEQWRKFGIEIVEEDLMPVEFTRRMQLGEFDAAGIHSWPLFCCAPPDPWLQWQAAHEKYYKPIGEIAPAGQYGRWVNHKVSELLDEMSGLPYASPEVVERAIEIVKISFEEMPIINMFQGSKLLLWDSYVWENLPTGDNYYWPPCQWCPPSFKYILPRIRPTGNFPTTEKPPEIPAITYVNVWIIGEVGQFFGVDKKVYGPYKGGEFVSLPKEDAERLIAQGLASYTPPAAPGIEELSETVSTMQGDIATIKSGIADLGSKVESLMALSDEVSRISESISALTNQISTLTTGVAIEAVVIVILAIGLVIALRRR